MKLQRYCKYFLSIKYVHYFIVMALLFTFSSCSKNQYLSGNENFNQSSARASKEIESSSYSYSSVLAEDISAKETIDSNNSKIIGKEKSSLVKKEKLPSEKLNHKNVKQVLSPSDEKPEKKTNKKAVSAFFFSVIGFIIPVLGLLLMSIGFAKGIKAWIEIKRNRREGKEETKGMGFALAAWIIPIAYMALLLLAAYFYIVITIFNSEDY